jgi:transcriptional regulator
VSTAPDDASSGRGEAPATGPFERYSPADVRALIAEFPLAWVCAPSARPFAASLLPLIAEFDAAGALTCLIGHLGRRNALVPALTADPRAAILFKGPDAYVSPEHAGRRDWAPTWNYAQLCIEAEVRFSVEETQSAVARLVETMESGRGEPWREHELGGRYEGMMRQIVGFRAEVKTLSGRFKLGQDETPETLRAIVESADDPALGRWMQRMNGGR